MGYYEFKEADALEFARASGIQTKKRGDELQLYGVLIAMVDGMEIKGRSPSI